MITPADMTEWAAKAAFEKTAAHPLGSPHNPLVLPPALYDAVKSDPRFRDLCVVRNDPLP